MKIVRTFCFSLMAFAMFSAATVLAQSTITLSVDATEAPRKLLHSTESISTSGGAMTLYYPQWIPGEHGPTGPVTDVAGLKISIGGKEIAWKRDLVDMYAVHCDVPSGSDHVDVSFDFLLPASQSGFSSGASSSESLLILSWNQVVMYPLETRPENIMVTPGVKLPAGWKYGTALQGAHEKDGTIWFNAVNLNKLVDSPVLSSSHFKRVDLAPGSSTPQFLDMASDHDESLEITSEQTSDFQNLVKEAHALFGAHHYDHYDFLFTLSDQVAHFGLEHHESSDDRVSEKTLLDPAMWKSAGSLLPHEFTHSWNGKYRRPAGLATGDFSTPMKGDLLWVYEGMTQFIGNMLAARSGIWSPDEYRDQLATTAAYLDNEPGRTWRPLQDCADEAQLLYNSRGDWRAYRRGTDFYDEGNLIWLDVDVTIMQLTKGAKSIDDFTKIFHGGENTSPMVKPYTFDDVVTALNSVVKNDWNKFLTDRLQSLAAHAPLGGIENGGYKLVYKDTPNGMQRTYESTRHTDDESYSIGLVIGGSNGAVYDVLPGTPGFKAGMAPGMTILAVDGKKYSKEGLRDALKAAVKGSAKIDLLVQSGEFYRTYSIDYHGGPRFPYLVRDDSKPDLLSQVIKAHAGN
ncbi:MAG TPA: M61 family peptidase [Bacteroidota bacterium]|nr:M61 family peptidase [Bacteroidota bacterium]